jgi:hypothetical protein
VNSGERWRYAVNNEGRLEGGFECGFGGMRLEVKSKFAIESGRDWEGFEGKEYARNLKLVVTIVGLLICFLFCYKS